MELTTLNLDQLVLVET